MVERAEKFVLYVCFPVMQQIVFTQTFVQKRVTIKFRYLVYEKLLLSYIKNYSHEYKRNLTN